MPAMNDDADCHEIPDCSGVYVDAFRRNYWAKTTNRENVFILSHYHGDHYGSLPREGGYQGPAKIHCTPITAELLVRVHGVHESLVVAHELGNTWTIDRASRRGTLIRVTFYDANHCPGAAIVLFETDKGRFHLHTGDFRYHERMTSYPLLHTAAVNRQIDTVFLDTTYAHPKHSFLPQNEAVNSIAEQSVELLAQGQPKSLILLSCYSIGKEKVLWEVARRTKQSIFANERKRRMLECIRTQDNSGDPSLDIIKYCTDDPTASDIHIIPMGVAGKIWPFFQPDYTSCLEYAKQQNRSYERVVAFLPTGWADASNWNKKNACKTINVDGVTISVRLVAYSEHSTFVELQRMVAFLQPRLVIPTVYSDKNDRRKIQGRFCGSIDSKRAKEAFVRSMNAGTKASRDPSPLKKELESLAKARSLPENTSRSQGIMVVPVSSAMNRKRTPRVELGQSSDKKQTKQSDVDSLVAMGFTECVVREALAATGSDFNAALDRLLETNTANGTEASRKRKEPSGVSQKRSPSKVAPPGNQTITAFFSVKKR